MDVVKNLGTSRHSDQLNNQMTKATALVALKTQIKLAVIYSDQRFRLSVRAK
jgi:hypothetical protein